MEGDTTKITVYAYISVVRCTFLMHHH